MFFRRQENLREASLSGHTGLRDMVVRLASDLRYQVGGLAISESFVLCEFEEAYMCLCVSICVCVCVFVCLCVCVHTHAHAT